MATERETGRREEEEELELISQIDSIDLNRASSDLGSDGPQSNASVEDLCYSSGPVSDDIVCAGTVSNDDRSIHSTRPGNSSDYQSIYPTRPTTNPSEYRRVYSTRPTDNPSEYQNIYATRPTSNPSVYENIYATRPTTNPSEYQNIYATRTTSNPSENQSIYATRPTSNPSEYQKIYATRPTSNPSEYQSIYATRPTSNPSVYENIYSTRPTANPSEHQNIYSARPANPTAYKSIYSVQPSNPSTYRTFYSSRPANPTAYQSIYSVQPSNPSTYPTFYSSRPVNPFIYSGQSTDHSAWSPNYSSQKGSYPNQSTNHTSHHTHDSTRQASNVTRALGRVEKQVVTADIKSKTAIDGTADKTSDTEAADRNSNSQKQEYRIGPVWSWEDLLLKEKEKIVGDGKKRKTFLWRPGSGRHVDEGPDSYRPFTHVGRVLHVDDAVDVLLTQRIKPKSVVAFSCINSRELPPDHPCARLKVLWFGAKCKDAEESPSNWYGNVEFLLDAHLLVTQWKHWFLVEMMTTATHTASRILVTNSDYSSVLPIYNHRITGGPWRVTAEGQKGLIKCSRYKFRGTNVHNHVLEFMVEAKPEDERAILAASQLSFVNHDKARHGHIPHVCSRYQKERKPCPTPFSACQAARYLFRILKQQGVQWNTLMPKLSPEAQKDLQWFNEDERITAMQFQAKR